MNKINRPRPSASDRRSAPRRHSPAQRDPALRFTPYAWAKLQWFCHAGAPASQTEIGGFGITSSDDLLLIEDFATVRQQVSAVTVKFDDPAVADYFEDQVDRGLKPEQFARVWLHIHPGNCPNPSGTDEQTFARVFGHCDWAVMFILAEGGDTYARLRFNTGPGGDCLLPVELDCQVEFPASDLRGWEEEYNAHIHPECLEARVFDFDPAEIDEAWLHPFDLDDAELIAEFDPDTPHPPYLNALLEPETEETS
jgi:proteasome lid subunit RPN8/RPN11